MSSGRGKETFHCPLAVALPPSHLGVLDLGWESLLLYVRALWKWRLT